MYRVGTQCDGEFATASAASGFSGSKNDYSLLMRLEGGAVYCLDNSVES